MEPVRKQLLQCLFILDALRNGWHVQLLNSKTFAFSKQESDITNDLFLKSKHFVKTFEANLV